MTTSDTAPDTSNADHENEAAMENNDTTNTPESGSALAVKSEGQNSGIELSKPRFFLGNRPIEPSNLKVLDTATTPGNRPIFASDMTVYSHDMLPGHRPVMASDDSLTHAPMLLGNRPIASNQVDDPLTLMGYLD